MRAIPRATPTTIPATVPLGSRLLGDGTGAPDVAFPVELLLVKVLDLVLGLLLWLVLGLVLLGVKEIGAGISFVEDPGLGGGAALLAGTELVDIEELVEPLSTSEDAGLRAGAVAPAYPPNSVIVRGPSVGRYTRE